MPVSFANSFLLLSSFRLRLLLLYFFARDEHFLRNDIQIPLENASRTKPTDVFTGYFDDCAEDKS
jgi:hypothetical protein